MGNSWANIGKKIKILRKVKNIKTKDIAACAGISSLSNYHLYEKGRSKFTPQMLEAIAKILGVTLEELMTNSLTLEDAIKQSQVVTINDPKHSEIVVNFLKNVDLLDENAVNAIMTLMQQISKNHEFISNPQNQIFKSKENLLSKFKSMEELLENNAELAEIAKDSSVKQEILALLGNFEHSLTKMLQKAQKIRDNLS